MSGAGDKEEQTKRKGDDQSLMSGERSLTMKSNCIDSRDLFVGTRDISILHGSEAYHLRLTAQNKLILTK
jgi:hemin uptake protein HemP